MADSAHIMIVESRYYEKIAEELIGSVLSELEMAGATYDRYEVPGAFEIPAAIGFAIEAEKRGKARQNYDGYIALGCVIRGQTTHYDYVCGESARGLQELALKESAAIGYGILTVENRDQAMQRARREGEDRGGHAARACLRMISLKKELGLGPK
jgi:6,7-dimethyl-8-ribityllumazine synthase